jgi:hypothetical protein
MALSLRKLRSDIENVWPGNLGSTAPIWAQTAQSQRLVPRLRGRLATATLSDWEILAAWTMWKGGKLRSGEEGQQLFADIEARWVDFSDWMWSRYGT